MFAQVYAVAMLLAAFPQSFAFAATCSRKYTIKPGDSCRKISQDQHVSTYQLSATNPGIINQGCTNLNAGETICLGSTNEDCSTTHVVVASDTCRNIVAKNELSWTILYQNNPQLNEACDITAGEVLCISKTVKVPPPSSMTHTAVSTIVPPPPSNPSIPEGPTIVPAPPSNPSIPEGPTITFPRRRAVSTITLPLPSTSSAPKGITITFSSIATGADIVVPTSSHRN